VKANVETSLLTTKLNIPPVRPQLVSRPRLTGHLERSLGYNFTLVSAPAGFGKTTLVSEWVRRFKPPVYIAWISLDEGDNDPARFWEYFIAALRTIQSSLGETALALLRSPQPLPIEAILTPFINELNGIPEDFFLVLDDYHFIQSQPIHNGVTFLLEHLPPKMHLVIATRKDPPLPLARFRGRGTMSEVRTDDLRFTAEEAVSLLKALSAPTLSSDDVKALNTKADGWAAGLKMAVLSMRGEKNIPAFIAGFTGTQRYIMDYLLEEVLQRQPPEIREFLLKTSILERLSGSLCDAVTGDNNGKEILSRLENDNLFIVPLDETRQWYRYEHLFAELLRHRLAQELGKEAAAELQKRASDWYEGNGFPENAISQALAAKDWERAIRLLEHTSPRKGQRGEWVTVLGWMQEIPNDVLLSNPYVYWLYSKYLATFGRLDEAEVVLNNLEPFARQDTKLQGKIAAIRLMVAYARRDMERAMEFARTALALLPKEDIDERGFVCNIAGMAQMFKGAYSEAESLLKEAIENGRQTENYFTVAHSYTWLGTIYYYRGNLHKIYELCRQAISLIPPCPATSLPLTQLGRIFYEWNDLKAALTHLEQANELNRFGTSWEIQEWIYNELACTQLAMGNDRGAQETLEKIDRMIRDTDLAQSLFRPQTVSLHITLALRRGDLKEAMDWGSRISKYPVDVFLALGAIVHLLLAGDRKTEAAALLDEVYRWVTPDLHFSFIKVRLLQAETADTIEKGVSFLAEALKVAKPEGFMRTFADEGMPLAPLLRKAISAGSEPEYARKLLKIIKEEDRQRKVREGEISALPVTSGILSARELEVLRLLAEGLSNRQIADKLFISLHTAKVHVHHILDKLDARRRSHAIGRARELKLL
jgi:LuxR family maltose regulon positive regulatory protein